MNQTVLLDTHTFIWLDMDNAKLSPAATQYIADRTNRLLLSAASVWEIAIKLGTNRLQLSGDLVAVLTDQVAQNGIEILPITSAHAVAVQSLPSVHKDPFDRMLVAQSQVEQAVLLSCDPNIAKYPVTVIW